MVEKLYRIIDMGQLHPLISEGDGTQQKPFVVLAPGYHLAIKTEREVIESICNAPYDQILLRREYPENSDVCVNVVRDGAGERTICFDLRAAREGVESRRHLFDTPKGRATREKMSGMMVDLMVKQNNQRGGGCILAIGLIISAGAGINRLYQMIESL